MLGMVIHMAISVRQALTIGGLAKGRLVAGSGGLDKVVIWVDIMEVPDFSGWLRPNELILTCAYAIRNDPAAQVSLVETLSRNQVSALVIKPSRFLGSMPPEMIDVANRVGLPLIELPNEVPYIDVTYPLMTAIINEQARELEFVYDVHRRLTALVLERRGLSAIASTLSELIHRKVYVVGKRGAVMAPPACNVPQLTRCIQNAQNAQQGTYGRFFVSPIKSGDSLLGYVVVDLGEQGDLSPLEVRAVEHAVTVFALEITRLKAIQEAERRLRSDFIYDLISGNVDFNQMLALRAKALGIDIEARYAVLMADVDRFQERIAQAPNPETAARRIKEDMVEVAMEESELMGVRAVVAEQSDGVVVICSLGGTANDDLGTVLQYAERFSQRMAVEKQTPVSLGLSLPAMGAAGLPVAVSQARKALELGRVISGRGRVTCYKDLAVFALLEGSSSAALASFWEQEIGNKMRGSPREQQELLKTLRVFLECGGEKKKAADALFVHRNTLDYRLKKIGSMLNCDLGDPEVMFRLRLAIACGILTGKIPPF